MVASALLLASPLAGRTGLEPAASGVTGRRYNQLNYRPVSGGAGHTTGIGHHNEKVRGVSRMCNTRLASDCGAEMPLVLCAFGCARWLCWPCTALCVVAAFQ